MTSDYRLILGDTRHELAGLDAGSVQTCITSPPYYGLRDYGHPGQIGLEPSAIRETAKDWTTGGPGTGIENTADRYGAGNGGNDGLAKLAGAYSDGAAPTGRNRRSVWTVPTRPYPGAHFATFPPDLIEPCVLAGAPRDATVLDPFNGAGTTGLVALRHGRHYIGIELNPDYLELARDRLDTAIRLGHRPPERPAPVHDDQHALDLFAQESTG